MTLSIWYCSKCDDETNNYRTCQRCGTPAVYQRFMLWPIAHDGKLPECFINTDEAEGPKRKKRKSRRKAAAK